MMAFQSLTVSFKLFPDFPLPMLLFLELHFFLARYLIKPGQIDNGFSMASVQFEMEVLE